MWLVHTASNFSSAVARAQRLQRLGVYQQSRYAGWLARSRVRLRGGRMLTDSLVSVGPEWPQG
jgi:hypothetical protein